MPPTHVPQPSAEQPVPIPCAGCGYNLAGLPDEGLCPECAQPVQATLATLRINAIPLQCMNCSLRLTSPTALQNCPQCGVAIRDSLTWNETLRQLTLTPRHPELSWVFMTLALVLYFLALFVIQTWLHFNPLLILGIIVMIAAIFHATTLPDRTLPPKLTEPHGIARALALAIAGFYAWYWLADWMTITSASLANRSLWSNLATFAFVQGIMCHLGAVVCVVLFRKHRMQAISRSNAINHASPSA